MVSILSNLISRLAALILTPWNQPEYKRATHSSHLTWCHIPRDTCHSLCVWDRLNAKSVLIYLIFIVSTK